QRDRSHSQIADTSQRNVPRALPSQLSSLLDWGFSLECRHVDAGSRASVAGFEVDQLAVLARPRRFHGDRSRIRFHSCWRCVCRSNRSTPLTYLHADRGGTCSTVSCCSSRNKCRESLDGFEFLVCDGLLYVARESLVSRAHLRSRWS